MSKQEEAFKKHHEDSLKRWARQRYIWKYWIFPIITLMNPNSPRGLKLRADKLREDNK